MTTLSVAPSSRALYGIALMSAAMLIIPFADAVAKHLSAEHSPLWISWARYVAATAIILPIAIVRRGRDAVPRDDLGPHVLRTVFLMTAMTLYFVAIASVPLATANSAFFVGPIAASVLAVGILGERMTLRRTLALGCGVVGALLSDIRQLAGRPRLARRGDRRGGRSAAGPPRRLSETSWQQR